MTARTVAAVILAAGKGTRMQSESSKLVHEILGKPVVRYVADACRAAGVSRIIAVIGFDADTVKAALGSDVEYVYQHEQLGTGHALMTAARALSPPVGIGDLFVLVGDAPFITPEILRTLLAQHRRAGAAATFLSAEFEQTPPYGRVIRDVDGRVTAIIEEPDCTPEQKQIREVITSQYCFRAEDALPLLSEMRPNAKKGEYYLTEMVEVLARHGYRVEACPVQDRRVVRGINDRSDLVEAIAFFRARIIAQWLARGVTVIDPETAFIDATVKIGRGTVIHPHVYLATGTVIGERCEIGPFVELRGARIGAGARLAFLAVIGGEVAPGACPLPFQRLGDR